MRLRPAAFALVFGLVLAAACGPGNANGPGSIPPVVAPTDPDAGLAPTSVDAAVTSDPVPAPSAQPDAGLAITGPKLCGCGLCDPLFSDDACTADADCAPSAYCHAEACVAKAKAPARPKNVMCTEIMKCGSADANGCGCVQGKCALFPRRKP